VTYTEPDTRPAVGSDALLIERSWLEPERFARVFDRYYAEIHGYVARRLGPSRADDVASETFLIAFDRRRRYDVAHPDARPWLYGIASNLVSRHHRAETRRYRALARAGVSDAVDGHADDRRRARRAPLRPRRHRPPGTSPGGRAYRLRVSASRAGAPRGWRGTCG
jgi:DNA-directed RNA polymerase specialized sigma24 family protein